MNGFIPQYSAGDPTFGVSEKVAEPALGGAPLSKAGITINAGVVGGPSVSDRSQQLYPSSRDWALAISAERVKDHVGGSPSIQNPPDISATISFGTGAVQNTFDFDVPVCGLVLHVTGQWIQVQTFVRGIATPGEVLVRVGGQPGTVQHQVFSQKVSYPGPDGDTFVLVRAPRFATQLSVFTQALPVAGGAQVGLGAWRYRSDVNGSPAGLAVTDPLPLSLSALVTTANAGNAGVFVPPNANAVLLSPRGAAGFHMLQWGFQS